MNEDLPEGWRLNPDEEVVARVRRALDRSGGDCPCVPANEWNESTVCPCLKFRSGQGCHCNLYVRDDDE